MSKEIIRFEDFELDGGAFELRRGGRVVRLERIPLEVLFLLAERRALLVAREEILERIWGKDVFVDADNSINTAIRKIRQALRDNPEEPRFVQTVAGKGYRFVAPVDGVLASTDARPVEATALSAPAELQTGWRRWRLWLALAVVFVFAGAVLLRPAFLRRSRPNAGKVMLAVLPFQNLSDDLQQDYFADGMTEEMITQLGSLDPEHLGVIARTSAMQYKTAHKDAVQIARELGVNYLLEGSIRRAGERVRVTAQLVQSSDQTHLWADSYDRELSDVLKLQSEVARAIVGKIQLALSKQAEARLAGALSVNPEAHEAYLRGLQAWNLRTKEGFERSITEFNRAINVDPKYAPAYVGLAQSYSLAPIFGVSTAAETMPEARDAANRALTMDDSLSAAHTTLAFVHAHYEFDWAASEREYRRAIELNPSDALAHFFYSNSYLSPLGRHDAAIAEMKKAGELDPLSISIQSFLGLTYFWARRYDDAFAQLQRANQMNATFALNHQRLARYYMCVGRFDEAIREETKARLLAGEDPKIVVAKEEALGKALATGGPRGYWQKLLQLSEMKENPPEAFATPYGIARIYAQLGEGEKALESLEKAYSAREISLTEIGVEPTLDPLRSSPRFRRLLRMMRLTQ
jgi:TolB-like protein/DNA-binding winged helix-turn-helix (wHTH) protein